MGRGPDIQKPYRYTIGERLKDFASDHAEAIFGGAALFGVSAFGAGLGLGIGHFLQGDTQPKQLLLDAGIGAGMTDVSVILGVLTAGSLGAFK